MRVLGITGALRTVRNGWSQGVGDYIEYEYRGTPSYALSVYSQVRGFCADCEVVTDGPEGITRARYAAIQPGQEELRVEIRLSWNTTQKTIFEPAADGYSAGLSRDELELVKRALNPDNIEDQIDLISTGSDEAIALYDLSLKGVEYRTVFQPVLAQVTTASGQFTFPDQNANIGSVIDRASMLASLRTDPRFVAPPDPAVAPSGFSYGWKFMPPEYESNSDGHASEIQTFEFGLWAVQLEPSLQP